MDALQPAIDVLRLLASLFRSSGVASGETAAFRRAIMQRRLQSFDARNPRLMAATNRVSAPDYAVDRWQNFIRANATSNPHELTILMRGVRF
jgi:hypothetical protein